MKHKTLLIVAALALVAAGCGGEESSGKTNGGKESAAANNTSAGEPAVAIVNGVRIPESRINQYIPAAGDIQGEQRLAVIENMISSELIAQQAEKDGMRDSLRQQIIIAEQTVLGRAYITKFLTDNPVSEADIVALYDTLTQGAGASEYNVAHILVEDEGMANAFLAQILAAPDSFADIATEHSKDPGSAQNGGVLGWVSPGGLVPPFAEAMQKTAKGKIYPEVVKTDYGWHIIRVDDIREADLPALDDQIRGQLRQQAQAQKVTDHLRTLTEAAEIERIVDADNGGAEESES